MKAWPKSLPSLLAAIAACTSGQGQDIAIDGVLATPDDCVFQADGPRQSSGQLDPARAAFMMTVALVNRLAPGSEVVTPGTVSDNNNGITVQGFDVCWDLQSAVAGKFGATAEALLDCEALPAAQKAFAPSSGLIAPGGKLAVGFDVLATDQLRGLFGSAFAPASILASDDPTNLTTRSAAWGSFPASASTTVLVQFRAVGALTGGGRAESNWFTFPIDLCVRCYESALGCGACQLASAAGICRPYQDFLGACDDVTGCVPGCGNGAIATSEACDDGNLFDGDGCSVACVVEAGFTCTGTPSACTSS